MPPGALVTKALQVAEVKLGIEELSRQLGVPAEQIRGWRMGRGTIPERKWFKLVDILMNVDPNWDEMTKPRP